MASMRVVPDRLMQVGLPANLDAERLVLGAILANGHSFPNVAAALSIEDFSLESHKRIWLAMYELHAAGSSIDLVVLASRLRDKRQLESVGNYSYLASLGDGLAAIFDVDDYVKIVKDKSILRRAYITYSKLADECLSTAEPTEEILSRSEKLTRDLASETARDRSLRTAGEIVMEAGGLQEFLARGKRKGVPTPWPTLSYWLGGFRPQQMITLAAKTGVGKTAIALQIANHAAGKHGIPVALYSLEMSNEELITRMICSRARVPSELLRNDNLNADDRRRLTEATAEIAEMPIVYDDTAGCTIPSIHASLRRAMAVRQIGLVIIDYLQLVQSSTRRENRTQEVSEVSRGIKLMARDFNVPVIALSQLKRTDEREPVLSDLRESGSIEQDSDVVIFLHPKSTDYSLPVRPMRMIIAKQRNGPVSGINMNFFKSFTTLEESTEEECAE